MSESEALKQLRAAREAKQRAEKDVEVAFTALRSAAREAREAGVPVARCAEELGMSRQGVYAMLEREET